MLSKMLELLKKIFTTDSNTIKEDYLSQATTIADVEDRMRQLNNGRSPFGY